MARTSKKKSDVEITRTGSQVFFEKIGDQLAVVVAVQNPDKTMRATAITFRNTTDLGTFVTGLFDKAAEIWPDDPEMKEWLDPNINWIPVSQRTTKKGGKAH